MYWPVLFLIDKSGRIRYVHFGKGAYEELLAVFEAVGIELRPEIDARFAKFK